MGNWFKIHKELEPSQKAVLTIASFLLPLILWSCLSYIPSLWHPMKEVTSAGKSFLLEKGQVISAEDFNLELENLKKDGVAIENLPTAIPSNPIYLPAPHEVARAFYTAFTAEPKRRGEPWLHESLLHSITIVFLAFLYSSLIGIPLGIIAGSFSFFSKLIEPFVEFFRYLPAPAFGALAVAILGINDAPKIAIIVIGTLFQQILVIANTVKGIDYALIEAAQTLGASKSQLILKVIIPGILPQLFRDTRILLGWAWTYLIVAEVVGASSGITWFINQQAKYRIYENVYAAIIMIGMIGLITDMILSFISQNIFPWENSNKSKAAIYSRAVLYRFFQNDQVFFYKEGSEGKA